MATGLTIRNGDDLRALLSDPDQQVRIFAGLPKGITQERMIALAVRALMKDPKLYECNPVTILDSIAQASSLGLEPDGVLGHSYLVPYGEECVLVPGYRGLIDLARRSGAVRDLTTEIVREGDEFDYQLGDEPHIRHRPSEDELRECQPVTHVYCVCNLTGGGKQRSVWTKDKIERHRKQYSKRKSGKDNPWETAWPKMAMKTVVRSMINQGMIPVSAEVQRMTSYEEYSEFGLGGPQTTVTDVPPRNMSDILEDTEMPNTDATPADNKQFIPSANEPDLLDRFANRLAECKAQRDINTAYEEFIEFADDANREHMQEMTHVCGQQLRQAENEQQRHEGFSLDAAGEDGN